MREDAKDMKIYEFQAHQIFHAPEIPVPKGDVADTCKMAKKIAEGLKKPIMIKAQVLVGGRGKTGGMKLARNPTEAYRIARGIIRLEN